MGPDATTLEYTSADFGIAALAGRLGEHVDAGHGSCAGRSWQNLFNPSNAAASSPATATAPSSPLRSGRLEPYVEGNGAQYHWMVPYDVAGLFDAMGGNGAAATRLDTFFTELNAGPHQPYAFLGNEPSLETPWLYDYAGAPYRTQDVVRRAVNTLYGPAPDGVGRQRRPRLDVVLVRLGRARHVPAGPGPGRDSSWPARCSRTSPSTGRAGRAITINAPGASADTYHVQALKVNGQASEQGLAAGVLRHQGRHARLLPRAHAEHVLGKPRRRRPAVLPQGREAVLHQHRSRTGADQPGWEGRAGFRHRPVTAGHPRRFALDGPPAVRYHRHPRGRHAQGSGERHEGRDHVGATAERNPVSTRCRWH